MEELLAKTSFKVRGFSVGQKIKAKVLEIGKKSVTLDIGGKSEGVVINLAYEEASDFIKTLKPGDEVMTTVIVPETNEGYPLLSLRQAASDSTWEHLEKFSKEKTPISVYVKGVTDAGISVEVDSVSGFIPTSQLGKEAIKSKDDLSGKHLKVRIIELDRMRNKIVFSEKAVSEAGDVELVEKAMKKVKEGEIYKGIVKKVTNFGAFIEIPVKLDGKEVGIEGLAHISELSWDKIGDPSEVLKEGDEAQVKVIGERGGKLALSFKQAQEDPWQKAEEKYKPETKVKGKILRQSDYGVFVQLEPGIEGLVHMTKIPPATKIKDGDEVDVYVEEMDPQSRKISLGLVLKVKPVGYK